MKVTINKADLSNPAAVAALVSIISNAKHGGFMRVHGLRPKEPKGRIADYTFQKGISYPVALAKSNEMLKAIQSNPAFTIPVSRGTWQDGKGNISPTNRKSKDFPNFVKVEKTYDMEHPAMNEALLKLDLSINAPQPPTKEYRALGNGVYADVEGKVYIRDLRFVSRDIIVEGEVKPKASEEANAIRDAIEKTMPIGNYRQFGLAQDYDSLVLDGMEIAQADIDALHMTEQEREAAAITAAAETATAADEVNTTLAQVMETPAE